MGASVGWGRVPPESPENAERFEVLPRLDGADGLSSTPPTTDPPSRDDGRLGGLSLEPPVRLTLSSDNTAGEEDGFSSSLSHFPKPVTSENACVKPGPAAGDAAGVTYLGASPVLGSTRRATSRDAHSLAARTIPRGPMEAHTPRAACATCARNRRCSRSTAR